MIQKRTLKTVGSQLSPKALGQVVQTGKSVIVTDRAANGFPDVFLWIEIWRSYWKQHDFQTRMGSQECSEGRAPVPWGTNPQQQDAAVGKSIEDGLQMARTRLSIYDRLTGGDVIASMQIESAEEVGLSATGSTRTIAVSPRDAQTCYAAISSRLCFMPDIYQRLGARGFFILHKRPTATIIDYPCVSQVVECP